MSLVDDYSFEDLILMTKPGPKPEHGETRTYHTIRTTDDCWTWCKTLGGAGKILQDLYASEEGRAWLREFMEGRKDVIPDTDK